MKTVLFICLFCLFVAAMLLTLGVAYLLYDEIDKVHREKKERHRR